MLPSVYRLPKKDFIQTMRCGTRVLIDGIQFISTTSESSHACLGILITKKFSKKAVDRNHMKRQITMAFLPYFQKGATTKNIVCKITQPLPQSSFDDIQIIVGKYITAAS